MSDNFFFGLALVATFLWAGHWFPWPRKLPRVLAYTYGMAVILGGMAVWLLPGEWRLWLGIFAFAVTGGLATLAAYAYDVWRNHEVTREADRERDRRA